MNFGLSQAIIAEIRSVFSTFEGIEKAAIFGSRATGKYKANSDIDIVLWGQLDYKDILRITDRLEQLPTPYTYDVKSHNSITHQPLKEHIDKFAKMIYKK